MTDSIIIHADIEKKLVYTILSIEYYCSTYIHLTLIFFQLIIISIGKLIFKSIKPNSSH